MSESIPIIENLANRCDKIKTETIYKLINSPTPIVSIATLSLFRYELLFKTIKHSAKLCKMPLNICLRVQAAEEMPLNLKIQLLELLDKYYYNYDLQFTYQNHGSGVPRHDVVHRALNHYNSKYIITLDDDILMPQYGFEVMAAILEDNPNLGCINLWLDPWYASWKLEKTKLLRQGVVNPYYLTDATGSGTMMMRKEVFEKCDLDNQYYIGWGDIDFCMQLRNAGWDIGVLAIPGFKGFNIGSKEKKYLKIRYDKQHTSASLNRFHTKWGIQIK
jgi:hypothetical protein